MWIGHGKCSTSGSRGVVLLAKGRNHVALRQPIRHKPATILDILPSSAVAPSLSNLTLAHNLSSSGLALFIAALHPMSTWAHSYVEICTAN